VVKYPFNNINIVIFLSTSTIKSLLVDPFMFHIGYMQSGILVQWALSLGYTKMLQK